MTRNSDDVATVRNEFELALRELGASDSEASELTSTTDLDDCIDASCLAHERLASMRGKPSL